MLYKGKTVEIVGEKDVFGQSIGWIQILEDRELFQFYNITV
ncbi:MAG: hypothetical protein PF484_13145 [Bacteroidales bacterium]|jgi:hypothetical protein|nr:hypothetical protein [Bacteroidales bacterium]